MMIQTIPFGLVYLTVTVILLAESWEDFRKREINLELLAVGYIMCLSTLIIFEPQFDYIFSFAGFAIGFFPFFCMAWFGKSGGGDAVLMGYVGIVLGAELLAYIIVFSAVTYCIQGGITAICMRKNKDFHVWRMSFPYVPHVAMGWISTITYMLIVV